MFFIVNKTKGTITLGDLGISLGPKQAMDLDKIMQREKSETSMSLKSAKSHGDIEIRIKDDPKSHKTPNTKPIDKMDFSGIKKDIIDEMKELLKNQTGGVSKEDLETMMQTLVKALPKQETVIIRQDGENIRKDEEVEIDEDTLAKINARTVNEIVKDTQVGSVHYKEKQEKNTILDNVNELENLLG